MDQNDINQCFNREKETIILSMLAKMERWIWQLMFLKEEKKANVYETFEPNSIQETRENIINVPFNRFKMFVAKTTNSHRSKNSKKESKLSVQCLQNELNS